MESRMLADLREVLVLAKQLRQPFLIYLIEMAIIEAELLARNRNANP